MNGNEPDSGSLTGELSIGGHLPVFEVLRRTTMSKKEPQARVGGRDSTNGKFVPLSETYQRPATTQREHIPLPGYGDTGRGKDDKKS